MKILVHSIFFAPVLTGVGKYTGEMTAWLTAQGHDVRVVTAPPYYPDWQIAPGYRACMYETERWEGAQVWRCPVWVPASPKGLNRLLHLASFSVSSFPAMVSQLTWRPDIVWVVEPPLFCAPTAWLVARLCGAVAWLHVQDYEVDAAFELGLLRGNGVRRVISRLERGLMRRFDRVSSISSRMLERARTKGVSPARLVSFPNWADVKVAGPSAEPNRMRGELGISPEHVVALYSGTMGLKQGLEILSQAATRLQQAPDVLFVFCGNGPARDDLETLCDGLPNVRFLDLQPVERLAELLNMADIHLLPQQAGAADLVMPSKLTGMLASGAPVVATCAENTELALVVQDRGIVVPPDDSEALVRAILTLADDKDLRTRFGANALAYAQKHLSRGAVLAAFEKALEEALTA